MANDSPVRSEVVPDPAEFELAGAIVPADAKPAAIAPLAAGPAGGAGPVFTNWPAGTPESQRAVFTALAGCDRALADALGETIEVTHALFHFVTLDQPETGEVAQAPRVILWTAGGATVGCCSWGVLRALQSLSAVYGPGPWSPGLRLVPRQVSTRRGRRLFTLTLAPEVGEDAPVKEKKSGRS